MSGTKKVELENCHTVQSLEEVWEKEKNTGRDIFICGGASVYEEALRNTDKIYVTKLLEKVEGDTFFPMFSEEEFVEKSCEILVPQKAVFYEYERVQKKGKFMLSTLKDLWYDGKMVTKEKQCGFSMKKVVNGKFFRRDFSKLYAAGRGYNLSAHDYFTCGR